MATEVILPKVDMAMESGIIHAWKVAEGDAVKAGDLLFEIETDKANMEIEAPAAGVLGKILVREGVVIPVGAVVAYITAPGEAIPQGAAAAVAAVAEAPTEKAAPVAVAAAAVVEGDGKVRATPLARSLARASSVDLTKVNGSGPRGRIVAQGTPPDLARQPQRSHTSRVLAEFLATRSR